MSKKYLVCLLAAATVISTVPAQAAELFCAPEESVYEAFSSGEETEEETVSEPEIITEATVMETEEPVIDSEAPENVEAALASGECGANLTWNLDSAGVLTISGRGAMNNYNQEYEQPWRDFSSQIKKVVFSEGVTVIGQKTFSYARSLESVSIPSTVTRIEHKAFNSTGLKSVKIPGSVVMIGSSAFEWCENLNSVTIEEGTKKLTIGGGAFYNDSSLNSLSLPARVTTIEGSAFSECANLRSVTLKEGLTTLNLRAFAGTGLESVRIPRTVTAMESEVFMNCKSLKTVVVEEGVSALGTGVFQDCSALRSVSLPSTLKKLPGAAFLRCTSLTKIVLPKGMVRIDDSTPFQGAFMNCTSLSEISLPSTLTYIGRSAFEGCTSLTAITIPDGVTEISDRVFFGCKRLNAIKIPEKVTGLGNTVFGQCAALSSINIPNGIKYINSGTFSGCSNLLNITIPGSVAFIKDGAFDGCVSLGEVYFQGDAPFMEYSYVFRGVIADMYYPKDNPTWTEKVLQNYWGTLNWVGYKPALNVPVLGAVSNTADGIKLTWGTVNGAEGYAVYRKTGSGNYTYIGRASKNSYEDKSAKAGTSYVYTVRAYRGGFSQANANQFKEDYWSKCDEKGLGIRRLTTSKISSLTNGSAGISLKWKKVTGAGGYYVYRKTGSGSYKKLAALSASTVSFVDKDVKNGTVYTYAVRPYNGKSAGTYTGSKIVRISRTAFKKASALGNGKVSLSWNRNSTATGYQISYQTGSTVKTKTVKGNTALSTTLTSLSRGKKYTIKIRCYKTVSGKNYYSSWSAAKSVTVK